MWGPKISLFACIAIILALPFSACATNVYQVDHSGNKESFNLHPKTVVLTFDDGPTEYTEQILQILKERKVRASFFVVGQNAISMPILQRILDEGHDLGNHTFNHANLSKLPDWQQRLEISLGRLAIESQTGRTTRLFRAPYQGSDSGAVDSTDSPNTNVGQLGYVVAGVDVDTADWNTRYAGEIRSLAADHLPGGVILLHDGGGDRSKTVQALPGIIDDYQRGGYKFQPLGEAIGLTPDQAMPPLKGVSALAADTAGVVFTVFGWINNSAGIVVIGLILAGLARAALLVVCAILHARRRRRIPKVVDVPCSVIIPAYNEAASIQSCIRSVLANKYRRFEVIVVDDGSTDNTAEMAMAINDPRLRVFSKPNDGKASALNYGINLARTNTVVAIDADTVFRTDTLFNLCHHFSDPKVGAVSGNTKIINRRNLITRLQSLEYIIGFNLDRRMGDLFDCITVVPGAIGAFRKNALLRAGGFQTDTLAEDTDLTLSIKRLDYKIVYDEFSVAYTEAPDSISDLLKQRFRWTFGTMQAVYKHHGAMLRPKYGTLGLIGLPYLLLFQIVFPLLGPLFDVVMVISLLSGQGQIILVSLVIYLVIDTLLAAIALKLDGESLKQLWLIVPQRLLYRQLMYFVIGKSIVSVLRGRLVHWGNLKRDGAGLAKAVG